MKVIKKHVYLLQYAERFITEKGFTHICYHVIQIKKPTEKFTLILRRETYTKGSVFLQNFAPIYRLSHKY